MVDVQALNTLLLSITIICAVVFAAGIAAIALTWRASVKRRERVVASGVRAAEEHLAAAASNHAAY
ncbi:MAG TPA: hypothetical protein VKD26_09815 [Streptosporangiaceae bacterium]|nr:hypothetical protein [Streptosporangiaceae bacterium]